MHKIVFVVETVFIGL